MRIRWPILATCLSIGLIYVAYPYVILYRLGDAISRADAATLETLVDWPSVREGIKEDICDLVVDEADPRKGKELPPFGASFVRGIASNTIDQKVTPQAIVAATVALPTHQQAADRPGADVHVDWAFFEGPSQFSISLRSKGLANPIRLEMSMHGGLWQVRRVWLPPELLTNKPART